MMSGNPKNNIEKFQKYFFYSQNSFFWKISRTSWNQKVVTRNKLRHQKMVTRNKPRHQKVVTRNKPRHQKVVTRNKYEKIHPRNFFHTIFRFEATLNRFGYSIIINKLPVKNLETKKLSPGENVGTK